MTAPAALALLAGAVAAAGAGFVGVTSLDWPVPSQGFFEMVLITAAAVYSFVELGTRRRLFLGLAAVAGATGVGGAVTLAVDLPLSAYDAAKVLLAVALVGAAAAAVRIARGGAGTEAPRGALVAVAALVVAATHEAVLALMVRQYPERVVGGDEYRGPTLPVILWTALVVGAIAVFAVAVIQLLRRRAAIGFRLPLVVIVAGGYLVRVGALLTVAPERTDGGDPLYYHAQANLLASGRGFLEPLNWIAHALTLPSALHGPLYSVYLSMFSRLGATTYFDHKMASILVGTAVIPVAALIGRRLGGPVVGLVAALLVATYPNLWVIDVVLFPEGLFVLLCGLAILTAFKWRDDYRGILTVVLGALIGLAALTRGEGVFLAPLMVAPWVLWAPRLTAPRKVRALAGVGLGLALTLGPWMVRNLTTFEEFVPLSTNGNELHAYSNCPDAYSGKFLGYWVFACQERIRAEVGDPPGDESQTSLYWRDQGFDYARAHLGEVPKVMLARVGRQWELFRPLQNVEFAAIENRPRGPTQIGLAMYYGLVGLAFVGARQLRRERRAWLPIGIQFVAVTVTAAYAYGTIRFRAPAELALCLLAAVAVVPLATRARERLQGKTDAPPRLSPRAQLGLAIGVLAAALLVPLRGLLLNQGPPMEEGFMLVFPERVLHGALPNRDFLHLYGPGGLWVLAAVYKVFGVSVTVERMVGFAQLAGIVSGVFALTRRWGLGVATAGALVTTLVIVPPIGLTALAWLGAVALAVWALVAALAGREAADERRGRRWLFIAGLVGGFALLYRLDVVLAVGASLGVAVWRADRARVRALGAGLAVGLSPYLVHLATAGPGTVVRGMVFDPIVYLRGGRGLPIPPPPGEFAGWLNRLGELWVIDWPLPALRSPAQLTAWFFLLLGSVAFVTITAVREARRAPGQPASRALLAAAVLSFGLLPQALQRADTAHLAWVSCVSFGLFPVALVTTLRRWRAQWNGLRRQVVAAGVAFGVLAVAIPHFTYRNYADLALQSVGRHRLSYPISYGGRTFYYGRADVAGVMPELLAEADRLTGPGDRLFVGTGDLRRTPYSEAFIYYLLPDLVPATYYIEMDPGVADDPGSRLADDLASADVVILSTLFDNWDEPNGSRDFGSDVPNQILAADFCLVHDYDGLYRLYARCSFDGGR